MLDDDNNPLNALYETPIIMEDGISSGQSSINIVWANDNDSDSSKYTISPYDRTFDKLFVQAVKEVTDVFDQ